MMTKMPPFKSVQRVFDATRLASMVEPLKVRIERLKDNKRTPVPMWDSESGATDGDGFTKDEIPRIEGYLVTEWAGGGFYEITVTDSNDPAESMKWTANWNVKEYPERTPPPLQGTRIAPEVINPPPQGNRLMASPAYPGFPNYPHPYGAPMPPAPQIGTQAFAHWRDEQDRRERETELKALREAKERQEREAIDARHKADLERERAVNNERFGRLETALSTLTTTLTTTLKEAVATPKGDSPEILAMREQVRATQEQMRQMQDQARRAEEIAAADRRDREMRDAMQRQAEATQRQLEEMQRRFEANASASSKPDPIYAVMQEQSRQSADALKEIARANQATMDKLQAFMMSPRDMMAMATDSHRGVEAATDRVTNFFGKVVEMQQRVTENALSMQPQSGGVVDVIRDGVNGVKDFAERYVASKTAEQKIAAQANVHIAQSQARVLEAQARASNPTAFVPPAPVEPSQLNGMPISVEMAPEPAMPKATERLWGRTDEEWFGTSVLSEIETLRAGVKVFHEACAANPSAKKEEIPGTHPEQAAVGIVKAAHFAQQHGIIVPAMIELLIPGQVSQFVAVLLPEANQQYRNEVVDLVEQLTKSGIVAKMDLDANILDEDEDDDEDESVDVPQPQPRAGRRNRARA